MIEKLCSEKQEEKVVERQVLFRTWWSSRARALGSQAVRIPPREPDALQTTKEEVI
jgi:hypothetical protein